MAKEMSVVEFPLFVEKWQADAMNNRFEIARKVYNAVLSHNLKKLKEIEKTKVYRADSTRLKEIYETEENLNKEIANIDKEDISKADKKKKKEDLKAQIQELNNERKLIYEKRNNIYKESGLTEFGFTGLGDYQKPYYNILPSSTFAYTIAKPMWSAFQKYLFGNGNAIHFKKCDTLNSIACNGKSGIRLLQDENGRYYILWANQRGNGRPLKMYVKIEKDNDYEQNMISRKISVIRIVRRLEKTKFHFYVQLTVEGLPYQKLDKDGNPKRDFSKKGKVGIQIWRNSIYAVSDDEVKSFKLSDGEEIKEQIKEISSKISDIRKQNNEDNYNEDGTIKKGIVVDGQRKKLKWHDSVSYKEAVRKRRELYRKDKINKSLLHKRIANEILTMGDSFYFMNASFFTDKPEWDEDNPLTRKEYIKKKERRRSIQDNAPAQLLRCIDEKLTALTRPFINRIDVPDDIYFYNHLKGCADKNSYSDYRVKIGDKILPHTLYRAFLAYHFDENNNCFFNMDKDFAKLMSII